MRYPFLTQVGTPGIIVSSNPINLINAHSLHSKPAREQCALTNLNGLLLEAVASKNGIHSRLV